MRLVSQLINGISRVLKYFNGIIIWTAFVLSSPVEALILCLNLSEALLSGKSFGARALFKASSSV